MKKYLLLLIIALAVVLRFWQLGKIPPSLTWDEVSWGYNAYSLGIDARDEFGRFLPHDYLESFGDFKPPMYAYLDILPVKFFGLNEFAVRFPSALFGVLTVLVTYFLVKRVFKNLKDIEKYALFSSLFLAISPWHIMLSRAAFEANIATFFLICGVWLFIYGIFEKKWLLPLSIISFGLSIYTFNTSRIVAPFLLLFLAIGFRKQLLNNKKYVLISVIAGLLIILPIFRFLLSPQASLRFKEVNIFSDIDVIRVANQEIANDNNSFWSKIIHNRRFAYSIEYIRHYFDNLNPNFLFIKGDGNPKFSTQDVGEMYLWDIPFLAIGVLFFLRRREGVWWILPLWLLIGIAPAATARETPHALRIETTLPIFQILTAYGFVQIMNYFKKHNNFVRNFLFGLLILNIIYFIHGYVVHYSKEFSGEWQYGYKESINFVKQIENSYDKVYVTEQLGRPYIYYLFYTKTNPKKFRENAIVKRDVFGFVTVERFGKYIFSKNVLEDKTRKNVLYIDVTDHVPSSVNVLKEVKLLNGTTILKIYTR